MFQVAEGIKGVHILGVVQSKDALEDLLKICQQSSEQICID